MAANYAKPNFKGMAERWPSSYVAREAVGRFSGFLLNPRTMANLDCKGEGPAERIRIGRKVAYPVDALIEWIEAREVA